MKRSPIQDSLILVLIGIAICVFAIMIPILYSPSELGASNIGNSIQFLTLLVGIITIAYVVKTFKLQRKEINENRKDVEFNRAIDMIYKQLEFTRQIHINDFGLNTGLIRYNNDLKAHFNNRPFSTVESNEEKYYRSFNTAKDFTEILNNDLQLLNRLVYGNKELSIDQVNILTTIINRNFYNDYEDSNQNLITLYSDKDDEEYRELISPIIREGYALHPLEGEIEQDIDNHLRLRTQMITQGKQNIIYQKEQKTEDEVNAVRQILGL